jgi:hypothetical protein
MALLSLRVIPAAPNNWRPYHYGEFRLIIGPNSLELTLLDHRQASFETTGVCRSISHQIIVHGGEIYYRHVVHWTKLDLINQ